MHTYSQSSGKLTACDGTVIGAGYSGSGEGKNNPSLEDIADVGPIPCGLYSIGAAIDHPKLGPLAMPLVPYSLNEMYGRSGFYIHGDSAEHPGQASEGCIILGHDVRAAISESEDRLLEVLP